MSISILSDDKLYEICEKLDEKSLRRVLRTSKNFNLICGPILDRRLETFYNRLMPILTEMSNIKGRNNYSWIDKRSDINSKTLSRLLDVLDKLDKRLNESIEGRKYENLSMALNFGLRSLIYEGINEETLDLVRETFKELFNKVQDRLNELINRKYY